MAGEDSARRLRFPDPREDVRAVTRTTCGTFVVVKDPPDGRTDPPTVRSDAVPCRRRSAGVRGIDGWSARAAFVRPPYGFLARMTRSDPGHQRRARSTDPPAVFDLDIATVMAYRFAALHLEDYSLVA